MSTQATIPTKEQPQPSSPVLSPTAAAKSFREFKQVRTSPPAAEKPASPSPAGEKQGTSPAAGVQQPSEPAKAGESAAAPETAEPETQEKPGDQKPHRDRTAEARIGELTAARKRAEQEATDLRKQLDELRAGSGAAATTVETKPPAKPAQAQGTPPKPKVDDFKTYEEYVEALSEYIAERKLAARDAEHKKAEDTRKAQEAAASHQERVRKAQEKYPNLQAEIDAAVAETGSLRNQGMEAALGELSGETLGDVLHHLATNVDEYRRIAALPPQQAYRETVRLELKLSTPAVSPEKPKPQSAVSKAPPPPAIVGGPAPTQPKDPREARNFREFKELRRRA